MKRDTKALVDGLVSNALDYLTQAVKCFGTSPKQSLVSFSLALELFLKARLMDEHWSLILASREEASWKKFVSAEFTSVSIREALTRIERAVGDRIPSQCIEAFEKLRLSRNKLVHFYYPEYDSNPDCKLEAARVQCIAWFYLYRLLTVDWKRVFEEYSTQINAAHTNMRKYKPFLETVFSHVADEITELKKKDAMFSVCPSCGYKSQYFLPSSEPVEDCKCLVCGLSHSSIMIACPTCGGHFLYFGDDVAICTHSRCGHSLTSDEVVEAVRMSLEHREFLGTTGEDEINCSECATCDVIECKKGYLCPHCLSYSTEVYPCEWCDSTCTGSNDESWWHGCVNCDGKQGDLGDD